jgi:pre-mRNA-splicing factor ATP-dependent RNA helicase DHX15/PRP43
MSFSITADGIMDPVGKYPNPLTGQPYSKGYLYLANKKKANGEPDGWTKFDTWRDRIDIIKKIHKYSILLVKIPPGTGKTVIVPKLLLHYFGYKRPVICTGPKQETVKLAAEYASKCLDVPLYQMNDTGGFVEDPNITAPKADKKIETGLRIVGYSHGSNKRMANKNTLLLFTTDGTVKGKIQGGDENLAGYGGIVVDEIHERSVNIDIVIAMLMNIVKRRPDFKVIFVSATMDLNLFQEYLKRIDLAHAYTIYSLPDSKPPFRRKIISELKRIDTQNLVDVVYKKINEIILNPQLPIGDILAFVTSDAEAGKIRKKIENNMRNFPINNKPYPLAIAAKTNNEEKDLATKAKVSSFPPTPDAPQGFARKVIIGTNVVESSVTFDTDIRYVVETGLSYEKLYDPVNYCYVTGKNYVSKASVDQRCGRTGRTCDGICYQLYTPWQLKEFEEFNSPQILQEDMTKDFLGIIALPTNGNLQKGLAYLSTMIEPPKNYQNAVKRAYSNLLNMDLINASGDITLLGRLLSQAFSKTDLKAGKMIVGSFFLQCHELAVPLAAILQNVASYEDIFMKPPGIDDDKEIERQYNENIAKLKDDRGDHLTLLKLYYFWINSPNPSEFAYTNKLKIGILSNIQRTEAELMKEVEKIVPWLNGLNLFNMPNIVPGVQHGGTNSLFTTRNISEFRGYKFDGEVIYEDDDNETIPTPANVLEGGYSSVDLDRELHSDIHGDSDDSDLDSEDLELSAISKMPSSAEIDSLIGGADEEARKNAGLLVSPTPEAKRELYKELSKNHAIGSSADIQNNSGVSELFDKVSWNGGGNSNDDSRSRRSSKIKQTSSKTLKHEPSSNSAAGISFNILREKDTINNKTRKRLISNLAFETSNDTSNKVSQLQLGGGVKKKEDAKAKEKEMQKKIERNRKIMDILTLKGLPQKTLVIPSDKIDRLYAALYFGFSNNIAAYSGSGKKYHVKFSPEKASIGKTIFDFNNQTPDWVIYNEFTKTKMPGRPDDAKLSIVSALRPQDFLTFLDINDIKKQL